MTLTNRLLLILLLLALTSCSGADGKTYYPVSPQQLAGVYVLGIMDACMDTARLNMLQDGIPLTVLNLNAAWVRCQQQANRLLQEFGTDIVPENLPSVMPQEGGRL